MTNPVEPTTNQTPCIQICGDPRKSLTETPADGQYHWYPLRVAYSSAARLLLLKERLDAEPTVDQTYVPMEYRPEESGRRPVPALNNLLFVRTTYEALKALKADRHTYEPLRYMVRHTEENGIPHKEILTVPEKQMEDFIRVTEERSTKVVFLDNLGFACRPGQRVRIIEGPLAGVEGTVKRIRGNQCVVVPVREVAAAAILGVPRRHLLYLPPTEEETT